MKRLLKLNRQLDELRSSNGIFSNAEGDEEEEQYFTIEEALLYGECILNNGNDITEVNAEEQQSFEFSKVLTFENETVSSSEVASNMWAIEASIDSIRAVFETEDSTIYVVYLIDLEWESIQELSIEVTVKVFMSNSTIPLIDVPCNLLSASTWTVSGYTGSTNNWVPDSRSGSPNVPVQFAQHVTSFYSRSYLALTYLLNKSSCNENLTTPGQPAPNEDGYWMFDVNTKSWDYYCPGNNPINNYFNSNDKIWSNIVVPPWGSPLQTRAQVQNEYSYLIDLANDNKPLGKGIIAYVVNGSGSCRATSGQVVRRSHVYTVTYARYVFVPYANS